MIDSTALASNVRQLLAQLLDESAAVAFVVAVFGLLALDDAAVAQAASEGRAVRHGGQEEGEDHNDGGCSHLGGVFLHLKADKINL